MYGFFHCFEYLFLIGIISFAIGRMLPKKWFDYEMFPYKPFEFEHGGAFYNRFGIKKWRDKVPDMSRILPGTIPEKSLSSKISAEQLDTLIKETCIAEFIHTVLCILGFRCVVIWPGAGGWIVSFLYMFLNIPFNMIQRFNRPKLARVAEFLRKKEQGAGAFEPGLCKRENQ